MSLWRARPARIPRPASLSDKFAEQVRQTLRNIQTILRGVGADMKDVVKVNTYLTDWLAFPGIQRHL